MADEIKMAGTRESRGTYVDSLAKAIVKGQSLAQVPGLLKEIIKGEMWRERLVAQVRGIAEFTTFRDFVEDYPPEGLHTTVDDLIKICRHYDDLEAVALLAPHSANRAAIEANLRNPPIQIPADPTAAGLYLATNMGQEWLTAMWGACQPETVTVPDNGLALQNPAPSTNEVFVHTCEACRDEFTSSKATGVIYCSPKCKQWGYRERNKAYPKIICEGCLKSFTPKRSTAVFCSGRCRQRVFRERQEAIRNVSAYVEVSEG